MFGNGGLGTHLSSVWMLRKGWRLRCLHFLQAPHAHLGAKSPEVDAAGVRRRADGVGAAGLVLGGRIVTIAEDRSLRDDISFVCDHVG